MSGVDAEALARIMIDRLNPVLPKSTYVEARGPFVECFGIDGPYGGVELDPSMNQAARPGAWSGLEITVAQLLSDVQDSVAHATRGQAWPASTAPSERPLPLPWAEVRGNELHLGYSDSVIQLAPIPLDAIAR